MKNACSHRQDDVDADGDNRGKIVVAEDPGGEKELDHGVNRRAAEQLPESRGLNELFHIHNHTFSFVALPRSPEGLMIRTRIRMAKTMASLYMELP